MTAVVSAITEILAPHGYVDAEMPVTVAQLEFPFRSALVGTRGSHDLVVTAPEGAAKDRLRSLMIGLNRQLDAHGSRRSVTLIVVGERPDRREQLLLEQLARVIYIDEAATTDQIRERIAVLLPLQIRKSGAQTREPLVEVRSRLEGATDLQDELLRVAPTGSEAVRTALRAATLTALGEPEDDG